MRRTGNPMSNADSGNANLPASPWIDDVDLRMLNQDVARRAQKVEPALIGLVSPFLEIPFEVAEGMSDRPVEPNSLTEHEFRLDRLPPKARSLFGHGHGAWRAAVTEAATAGIRELTELADLVFFMHHPERVSAEVGRLIARTDPDSFKLRAEWNRHRKNVIGILRSLACIVFLRPIQVRVMSITWRRPPQAE